MPTDVTRQKEKPKTIASLKGLGRHVVIENVQPSVDGGRYPAKGLVGQPCVVQADIFRDGHDVINAVVKWKRAKDKSFAEAPMAFVDNDLWQGQFPLDENTTYEFTVAAWTDRFRTWQADFKKRVDAGQQPKSDFEEGLLMIEAALRRASGAAKATVERILTSLRKPSMSPKQSLELLSEEKFLATMTALEDRADVAEFEPRLELAADRRLAGVGAWYELFVRSQGQDAAKSGTFKDAESRLDDIQAMGFDVVYLAPIHPIGTTARKGPNNSLKAGPKDPGSPWAIGNSVGGHTAVEPALGTLKDFEHFVDAARGRGIEIALDFAIQCSPDHPWVKEHPEWFYQRPDGTIKYAENPPKKYEDIYPLNFDSPAADTLWLELKNTLLFWIAHGVKIFRVDNPHTKPHPFWVWLLAEIRRDHPAVIFLSEAFTKPKMMKALAKAGFTQSYTYFTWRNDKAELAEYMTELTQSGMQHYFRPNFFANTPDILSEVLQKAGKPAFELRLLLAATLSPVYGIYSGYELCENEAVAGTEDYLNSEKYEIKPRDWSKPGNIKSLVTRLNQIRRDNPSLQALANLKILKVDNDHIIGFCKKSFDGRNILLIFVNMDPYLPQSGFAHLPMDFLGLPWESQYSVRDLLTDEVFTWSEHNFIQLTPGQKAGHILRVEKR